MALVAAPIVPGEPSHEVLLLLFANTFDVGQETLGPACPKHRGHPSPMRDHEFTILSVSPREASRCTHSSIVVRLGTASK